MRLARRGGVGGGISRPDETRSPWTIVALCRADPRVFELICHVGFGSEAAVKQSFAHRPLTV